MIGTRNIAVIAVSAVGIALSATAGVAEAGQVHYIGVHPVPDSDVFCHIEAPHVHVYAPPPKHAKVLYRTHKGTHHFVGDPAPFSYEGDKHAYYGHHPIHVGVNIDVDVDLDIVPDGYDHDYCYLDGPHYHAYAPPARLKFERKGNAYWYVGKFGPAYKKHKKRYVAINTVYHPLEYERPVVVLEERPAAYVGPVLEVHGPSVHIDTPGVGVRAGVGVDVDVHIPAPTLEVEVGLPGVIVIDKHKHTKHRRHFKHRKHTKHRRHRR